jgi:hypothetical protein
MGFFFVSRPGSASQAKNFEIFACGDKDNGKGGSDSPENDGLDRRRSK